MLGMAKLIWRWKRVGCLSFLPSPPFYLRLCAAWGRKLTCWIDRKTELVRIPKIGGTYHFIEGCVRSVYIWGLCFKPQENRRRLSPGHVPMLLVHMSVTERFDMPAARRMCFKSAFSCFPPPPRRTVLGCYVDVER